MLLMVGENEKCHEVYSITCNLWRSLTIAAISFLFISSIVAFYMISSTDIGSISGNSRWDKNGCCDVARVVFISLALRRPPIQTMTVLTHLLFLVIVKSVLVFFAFLIPRPAVWPVLTLLALLVLHLQR